MTKDKVDIAVEAFTSGNNCAQAVVKAFAEDLKMNEAQALQMASGFGAGMGRLQKTCGAVTGAFMVIGLNNSLAIQLDEERKDRTNQMIQEFEKRFIGAHQSSDCQELINCDLNTQEGQEYFANEQLGEFVCQNCIFSAVRILEEVL
jgi:C_GCAxxG_C_C family probable redox protein